MILTISHANKAKVASLEKSSKEIAGALRTCDYLLSRQYRHKPVRIMATPKASDEVRRFLAAAGAKGGKSLTEKKRAQLSKIASKGGKTVTPKKLAHLRKMVAERVARQRAKREGKN